MEYLIKVSAILILFYVCYKIFLNGETFFESNRSFLLLGLVLAFLLPLIKITKYIAVEPTINENAFVLDDALLQSQLMLENNSSVFITLITYLYVVGVLCFLGRFLLQFKALISLLIKSTKQRVSSYIYVITKNIISPFSFFNWIVFNPNQFSDIELEQIISHEKVHAKQLHSIDILLAELICIVLWFNPLVWLYKKDLRQNLEFIADKNAQATTNCKKSYQHLLLKTSLPNYKIALTNNFYNSLIKKRIVMLHKNKSKNRNQLKFLIVLPALVLFLMSFNTKDIYIEAKSSNIETAIISQKAKTIATTVNNTEVLKTESKPIATSKKTVASNNIVKSNIKLAQDIVTYFIESTFTDAKLDNVITKLKTHGITLKIKGVKRNSDNEITAIKIDAKSNTSNANFSISNNSAIKTIRITYNIKDNSISIGNTAGLIHDKDYEFIHKDGAITIGKSGKSDNVFVFSSDTHDDDHEVIEDDTKIIIKKGNKVHELKKALSDKDDHVFVLSGSKVIHTDTIEWKNGTHKFYGKNIVIISDEFDDTYKKHIKRINGDSIFISKGNEDDKFIITKDKDGNIIKEEVKEKGNTFTFESDNTIITSKPSDWKVLKSKEKGEDNIFISGDKNKKPLLIVDGKEVENKKLENIDVDTIESVNILKGKAAEKLYGKKGKNGVVEITLKKKKD